MAKFGYKYCSIITLSHPQENTNNEVGKGQVASTGFIYVSNNARTGFLSHPKLCDLLRFSIACCENSTVIVYKQWSMT